MNWTTNPLLHESVNQPVDRLSFDLVRAIIGARQAATATAIALRDCNGAADAAQPGDGDGRAAAMALLAGRPHPKVNDGAFARLDSTDRSCPNGDEHHG